MMQRTFASLLLAGLLSACGDGGTQAPPPSPIGDPPANPQDPRVSSQDPPANPNQPPANPNQPPVSAGGASQTGDDGNHGGDDGRAGAPNSGPGNSCTPAKGCSCDSLRKSCRCNGVDKDTCDLLPD